MTQRGPVVLILGSGPNVVQAADWPKDWFDQIVVMNNAWRVRPDWDAIVYPEDFPAERMPDRIRDDQQMIDASHFVPAQNAFGGFVFAGATMAYTTAYWALYAVQPRVMAFMGCDMVYPKSGNTHFYGSGTPDPLRDDITLRDLGAKSARLALTAANQNCVCVNLSDDPSSLLFRRAEASALKAFDSAPLIDLDRYETLRQREADLGYETPDGRYKALAETADLDALDAIDREWRAFFADDQHGPQL
jgi:hypothetical protein